MLGTVKRWLGMVIEVGLLLVALGIVLEILFSPLEPLSLKIGDLIGDLTRFIAENVGDSGLTGLIALSIILWLFMKKTPEI